MSIQQHTSGNGPTMQCSRITQVITSDSHLHQFFEIDMVLGGEAEVSINGKCEAVRTGEIAVIPAFRPHFLHTSEGVTLLSYVFSSSLLTGSFPSNTLLQPRCAHVFRPSAELWRYLVDSGFSDMNGYHSLDYEKDAGRIEILRSIFHLIIAEYYNSTTPTDEGVYEETLSVVLSYISEHYTEDLTLESVGAALGYSPKYISNCLCAIQGMNFRGLVNSMRVERAKELLRTTGLSNLEVALASGFNAESSFQRVFLQFVGCTPREYRRGAR